MADLSTLKGLVRKILVLMLGMRVGLLYSYCASGVAWAVWAGLLGLYSSAASLPIFRTYL